MSYARFVHSDVYVFMSTSGHLECCDCRLGDQWEFDSTQAMVDHLTAHRAAGHNVPDGIEDALWADDHSNWVDYPRCDLDGCDLRVTCGSPTDDGGYVSACSIEHAQTLGGFVGWPVRPGADRGTIDALATVLSLLPVAPLALAHWLGWGWAGALCAGLAVTAVVVCCCVQGGRSEGWKR